MAFGAAALFGASTPIAKSLVGHVSPALLAGLLYAGSGAGLAAVLIIRHLIGGKSAEKVNWPAPPDLPWLASAIFFGGIAGPLLLMVGLVSATASASALLLNLESVFTALLAWFVFRENFDRRIALGMALIVAGGLSLSWTPGERTFSSGTVFITLACLCWAIDNNLTRRISASDAMVIAAIKGVAAGTVNMAIATFTGAVPPPAATSRSS
jgi:drug/metabolite transporter (DMT)-like permease